MAQSRKEPDFSRDRRRINIYTRHERGWVRIKWGEVSKSHVFKNIVGDGKEFEMFSKCNRSLEKL